MRPETIDWNSIPDTISKDQFCKICHMSKRTATKYLGSEIPCSDNGKKTHRYAIAKSDLIAFFGANIGATADINYYTCCPLFQDRFQQLAAIRTSCILYA